MSIRKQKEKQVAFSFCFVFLACSCNNEKEKKLVIIVFFAFLSETKREKEVEFFFFVLWFCSRWISTRRKITTTKKCLLTSICSVSGILFHKKDNNKKSCYFGKYFSGFWITKKRTKYQSIVLFKVSYRIKQRKYQTLGISNKGISL